MAANLAQVSPELVQKAQQQQEQTNPTQKSSASKFDGVLANKAGEPSYVGPGTFPSQGLNLNGTQNVRATNEAARLKLQGFLKVNTDGATARAAIPVSAKSEPSRLAQTMAGIMSELEQGQVRMDQLISTGLSGKEMSNAEMLSLQASMYKYTQEMDLTGKVVEKATNGLKETLKTQV